MRPFALKGLAAGAALLAASPASAECLPFLDALRLAAERDPGVDAARAELAEASADLKDARSLTRPQLSAFGRTGVGDLGAVNSVVQNQVGLRASQRVYGFGDARFAREAARREKAASAEAVRQEKLSAAQRAGEAYLDLLEAEAQLQATEERRRYFGDLLRSVEALLSRGGATRSEHADVAARLADAEAAAQELRFFQERARTQLEIDTGGAVEACPAAQVGKALDSLGGEFEDPAAAVGAALAASPGLKELERRAESFDAARRRERRSRFPVIDVVGVAAYASRGETGVYEYQDRVGIDVTLPLYSGAALGARYDRAAARGAFAEAEAARARRALREETSIAVRRIASLKAQAESRSVVEEHKSRELAAAYAEYERGVRTLRELVETRLDYEEAVLDRIRVNFELQRRALDLVTLTAQLPIAPEARR